ncbi:MBL fold metallo-hydrolase [Streptantibioticus parmotrematis]|uniref:MBL fold metallo-hydrolase n=1 Tax=Streptantibioticus parmotrematis TaxID=2873249 RepID=UPI0033E6B087
METLRLTPDIVMLRFAVGQAYLIRGGDGFALVDSGPAGSADAVLDALRACGARPGDLREIVLTHSHTDHTGSAADLAAATGATIAAGAADAPVIRGEAPEPPPVLLDWERPLFEAVTPTVPPAPPTPVHRELADGDVLDWGITAHVLHVPGHTAGSVAVHLPHARAVFTGDTVAEAEGRVIPGVFNTDRAGVLAALRRLAALETETACFGHGDPVLTGAAEALRGAARVG